MRCVKYVLLLLMIGAFASSCASDHEEPDIEEGSIVKEIRSGAWSPDLTESEKNTLFCIVNDTLDWCVSGRPGKFEFGKYEITEKLKGEAATFVTLKMNGMLRGCIGSLEPVEELYISVHHNALNASMRDPRFAPVDAAERKQLEVHISILSPIKPIPSLDEFRIGEHGIILQKDGRRSVFLPEVAVEQGWNAEETLSALSQKAGLSANAWREGADFSVFSSVVLCKE